MKGGESQDCNVQSFDFRGQGTLSQELLDKIAIVTGCGQGIGQGIALELAKNGAHIVANDVNITTANSTADRIRELGRKALAIKADVTKSDQVESLVDRTLEEFGRIDILVNNAGIASLGPFTEVTEEEWDRVMAVNVKGMFLCCKFVVRQMIKQKDGRIVNIASRSGKTGAPLYAAYSASKFAVIGLTQSLAQEVGHLGINVNSVCPGVIDTSMLASELPEVEKYTGIPAAEQRKQFLSTITLGRLGTPEDIARVVVFLCSKASTYMTGQAINVTGGREMH
jgi:meso-butanediol dehydrogenase / (S,S)-butanediol dehydrogenase / diacetyl reductase